MKRQTVTDTQAEAFIAACLAPLPADSEPAETKEFLAQLKRARIDSKKAAEDAWYVGSMRIQAALHAREALTYARLYKQALGGEATPAASAAEEAALEERRRLVRLQMLLPAPSRVELKWKRRHLAFASSRAGVEAKKYEAAIAADEARLGVAA